MDTNNDGWDLYNSDLSGSKRLSRFYNKTVLKKIDNLNSILKQIVIQVQFNLDMSSFYIFNIRSSFVLLYLLEIFGLKG